MNYAGTDSSIYDLTTYLFKFYKYLLLLLLLLLWMLLLLLLLLMGAFHSTKIPLWNFGNSTCPFRGNLRSGVIFLFFWLLCFFASLARGEKNNAWYIYLTSFQPPPTLHNLTSAWPVMLLANLRLEDGNQILARIMSLLKSILGKRKFLSTSMFRWRFLKKN